MPTISITVSDLTADVLAERATELGPNWSVEDLASELVNDTFEDPDATAEYFTDAFAYPNPLVTDEPGTCSGPCKGHGVGKTSRAGACPTPCDPTILAALDKEARKEARLNAIADCMRHGENCICKGGTYTRHSNGCKTYKDLDGNDRCKYRVSYDYAGGTCNTLA